jgi:hypothetical protein
VIYDFEKALRMRTISFPQNQQITIPGDQFYQVPNCDLQFAPLKMAVWGCYDTGTDEEQKFGTLIPPCRNGPKVPSCQEVARVLHIEFCTKEKLALERQRQALEASERERTELYRAELRAALAARSSNAGASSSSTPPPQPGSTGGSSTHPPAGQGRPSGSGGPPPRQHGGSDPRNASQLRHTSVSQLTTQMSALNVGPRPTSEKRKQPYWLWDSKRQQFYHRHSDGHLSWSKTGR